MNPTRTTHDNPRAARAAFCLAAFCSLLIAATGCGSSGTATTTTTSVYPAAYQAAAWQSGATVSFPSECTMEFTSSGVPSFHNDYYLAPVNSEYPTVVATLPVTGTQVSVQPYTTGGETPTSLTVNICPTKASSTTTAGLGAIGYTLTGESLYNPYEADASTPALTDNASYTFTDSNNVQQTAYFIDQCNSHSNGHQWHFHAVPTCLVQTIDGSTGPSHLIGFALDGFPVYGGRDINGNVISVSQLDSCNGITSVTPEFSTPTYHYVLPIGVTSKYSSINCFSGTVSEEAMAQARRIFCRSKPKKAVG